MFMRDLYYQLYMMILFGTKCMYITPNKIKIL
jgi:hypothetical protein